MKDALMRSYGPIFNLPEALITKLKQMKQIKEGFMHNLLTGRVRVSVKEQEAVL